MKNLRGSRICLTGALLIGPLLFGSVEPWAVLVMQVIVLFGLLMFYIERAKESTGSFSVYVPPGLLPLGLFILYACLGLLPLPADVVGYLMDTRQQAHTAVRTAAGQGGKQWAMLSINPQATLLKLSLIVTYACFYLLCAQVFADGKRLKSVLKAVILFMGALAFFSIVHNVSGSREIFYLREIPERVIPFGPYVNRNHYAGLMVMVVPVASALFLASRPRVDFGSFIEGIKKALLHPMVNIHVLYGVSALLCAASVLRTNSRSGLLCLLVCTALFFGSVLLKKRRGADIALMVVLILALSLMAGYLGLESLFERFENMDDTGGYGRLIIWREVLPMIKDYLITGTGLGTFEDAYPAYSLSRKKLSLSHAHNDYMELLTDTGIIGFFLFAWFVLSIAVKSYRKVSVRRDPFSRYLFLAATASLCAIGLFSLTDFNLRIPANGLWFFMLLGLIASASTTRFHARGHSSLLRKASVSGHRKKVQAALAFVIILTLWAGAGQVAAKSAAYNEKKNPPLEKLPKELLVEVLESYKTASLLAPLDGGYLFKQGYVKRLMGENREAIPLLSGALWKKPFEAGYMQTLGMTMWELGRRKEALKLIYTAIDYEPSNPVRLRLAGSVHLSEGELDRAAAFLIKAIALEPENTGQYITLMVLNGFTDDEIKTVLPPMIRPHLVYGAFLVQTSTTEKAQRALTSAVELGALDPLATPRDFIGISGQFGALGLTYKALYALRTGSEVFPFNTEIKLKLARVYSAMGINGMAAKQYKTVLLIEPANIEAARELKSLTP